jgi:hypothetical protein
LFLGHCFLVHKVPKSFGEGGFLAIHPLQNFLRLRADLLPDFFRLFKIESRKPSFVRVWEKNLGEQRESSVTLPFVELTGV